MHSDRTDVVFGDRQLESAVSGLQPFCSEIIKCSSQSINNQEGVNWFWLCIRRGEHRDFMHGISLYSNFLLAIKIQQVDHQSNGLVVKMHVCGMTASCTKKSKIVYFRVSRPTDQLSTCRIFGNCHTTALGFEASNSWFQNSFGSKKIVHSPHRFLLYAEWMKLQIS